MAHAGNRVFGASQALRPKRISTNMEVRPASIFMRQPAEIMRLQHTLERSDSLPGLTGSLVPDQQRNGLPRSKGASEEMGGDSDGVFKFRQSHIPPRHSAARRTMVPTYEPEKALPSAAESPA